MWFDLNKLEQLTKQGKDFENQWNIWWAISLYQNAYNYWQQNWINEQQLSWLKSRIAELTSKNNTSKNTEIQNNPPEIQNNIQNTWQNVNNTQNTPSQTQQNIPQSINIPQPTKKADTTQNTTVVSQNTPIRTENTQNIVKTQPVDIQTHPDANKFHQLYQAAGWDWNKVVQDNNYSKYAQQNPDKIQEAKQYFDKLNETKQDIDNAKFWVWTTPEYRQQRNEQLVDDFIKQWEFNYKDVYNEIQSHQVGASNADVVHTVNTLQQMYLQKKKQIELQSTLNTPANELAKDVLTPDQKKILQEQDPNKLQQVQQLRDYQNLQNLYNQNRDTKFEQFIKNSYMQLLKTTVKAPDLQKEYNQLATENWLSEIWTKLTESKKKVQEIQDTMDHTLKDVEKEFAWTWATSSFIRREAQKRLEWLQEQYKVAAREYDEYAGQYKQIQSNINNQLSLKEKQYEYEQQSQQIAFQRLWIVNNLYKQEVAQKDQILNRFLDQQEKKQAQQEALDTFKSEMDYKLKAQYWDVNSKNPIIRKIAIENAVTDTLNQFKWWTFQRSKATIVNDVTKLVNKWMSLWDAIKQNITDKLHSNPQFNAWAANQIMIHQNETRPIVTKIWNTWYYYENWQWKIINPSNNPEKTLQILDQFKDWTKGWQCGTFVNNVLQAEWYNRVVKNTIEDKEKLINSKIPEIWDVAIMNSPTQPKYWHVAIVQKVNPDWTIVIKESNGTGNQLIWTRTIPTKDVLWYYNPKKDIKLTPADIVRFNSMGVWQAAKLTGEMKIKYEYFEDYKAGLYNKKWADLVKLLQFSRGWKQLTDSTWKWLTKINTAFNQINWLWNAIKETKTWPAIWRLIKENPYNVNAKTIQAWIQGTLPNWARWVFNEVWVLTDQDIKNYAETIPNLTNTEDQNKAILAMDLQILWNSYTSQLEWLARWHYDVSWYIWKIKDLQIKVNKLRKEIWMKPVKFYAKTVDIWDWDSVNSTNKNNSFTNSVLKIFSWITWNMIKKSNTWSTNKSNISSMENDAINLFWN